MWLPYKLGKAPKLRTPPPPHTHTQIVRLSLRIRKASNSWLGKMRCFPSVDNAVFRDLDELMNKGRGTIPFFSTVLLEVMQIWRGQFRYHGYILIMIRSQLLKRGLWGAKNTVSLQLWVTSLSRLSECLPVSFLLVSLFKLGPPPRGVCILVFPRSYAFSFPPGPGLCMESSMCERGGKMIQSAWKKKCWDIICLDIRTRYLKSGLFWKFHHKRELPHNPCFFAVSC